VCAHLHGVLVGEEVDDFEGVLDDAQRHQLLAVVAAKAHQRLRASGASGQQDGTGRGW
jgi:hypothetical protein